MNSYRRPSLSIECSKPESRLDIAILAVDASGFSLTKEIQKSSFRKFVLQMKRNEVGNVMILITKSEENKNRKVSEADVESQLKAHFAAENVDVTKLKFEGLKTIEDDTGSPYQRNSYKLDRLLQLEFEYLFSENISYYKPLRMTVSNTHRVNLVSSDELIVTVKVDAGIISRSNKQKLLCLPSNLDIQVRDIRQGKKSTAFARPGDTVDLVVNLRKKTNFEKISSGSVICANRYPVPLVKKYPY
jgi:translation elongation factor EF-1alpha